MNRKTPTESAKKSPTLSQDKNFVSADKYLWINPKSKHLKFIFAESGKILKDRICCGDQYVPQFALYPRMREVKKGRIINLFEVVAMMRGRELENTGLMIKEANHLGDRAEKKRLKENELPYITHSGIFIPRANTGLILPGFTFQLDIDQIENAEEILQKVISDENLNVLIASVSVSGVGVKALLFIKELLFLRDAWDHEQYTIAYHAATVILSSYFKDRYNLKIDTQMKAISQPFFLFYSPDLYINKNFRQWI